MLCLELLSRRVVVVDSCCILEIFLEHPVQEGIRDFCLSRGLGDVYKRQSLGTVVMCLELLSRRVVVDDSCCILEIFLEHPV